MLRQLTHDKTINPAKIMNEFQGPYIVHSIVKMTAILM